MSTIKQDRALGDTKFGFLMYFAPQHRTKSVLEESMGLLKTEQKKNFCHINSDRVLSCDKGGGMTNVISLK